MHPEERNGRGSGQHHLIRPAQVRSRGIQDDRESAGETCRELLYVPDLVLVLQVLEREPRREGVPLPATGHEASPPYFSASSAASRWAPSSSIIATPSLSFFADFSEETCEAVWMIFSAIEVLTASEGSLVRFESASSRPTRFIINGMASELTASDPKLRVGRRPFFMTRSRTILLVVRASDATPMSIASFALK